MGVFLRIDVDNGYSWENVFQKGLNKLCLNYPLIAPKLKIFGFQKYVPTLIERLREHDVQAGWFYQPYTVSKPDVLNLLKREGHTLAYHAVTTDILENFRKGKTFLEKKFGTEVKSMSKHGSGVLKLNRFHTPEYEPDKLLKFSMETGITLFTGNAETPDLPEEVHGTTKFIPGTYWINPSYRDEAKYNLDWLRDYAQSHTVIVLVHPLRIYMDKIVEQNFVAFLESGIKIEPFHHLEDQII